MSKKHVYTKNVNGIGDFVYVDLLPEVRRAGQFNVKVIVALAFAVLLTYFAIFIPYRDQTENFEQLNGHYNDLLHELTLTQEERDLHEINLDVIAFEQDIDELVLLRVDFNNLLDDVELKVLENGGEISVISYSAETQTLHVTVEMTNFYVFNSLEYDFIDLPWVLSTEFSDPTRSNGGVIYTSTFTLEVDPNVE